jgi:hypothetical protein
VSVMLSSLNGCVFSKKTPPTPKDVRIWWGKAGVQPDKVWQDHDWIIADKSIFSAAEK